MDGAIAQLAEGGRPALVLLVALLLGLRHAADPDHLAALTTLLAGSERRSARAGALLGLAWGLGHAATLVAFGLPLLLIGAALPESARRGFEAAVGLIVVALALRLLRQWRSGRFHIHEHEHEGGLRHAHLHGHAHETRHEHKHRPRTPLAAFSIGLLHGTAGSATMSVLVVATAGSSVTAIASLAVLAGATAVSMSLLSTGFALALVSHAGRGAPMVKPALGCVTLAFGSWYALAALELLPAM
ncbi:MAG: hypothetical protein ACRDOG_06250 [Gaiellaceae bacterium]